MKGWIGRFLARFGQVTPVTLAGTASVPRCIALVVGHNAVARGAVRVGDGISEHEWCGDLARRIAAHAPGSYHIIHRVPGTGEIARAYAQVDALGAEASVELHFNAAENAAATGTETLTSGTPASLALARRLQAAIVDVLGLRDRGLIEIGRDSGRRGAASLWAGRAPAVLIEPYFGSNRGDCAVVDGRLGELARAIHEACMGWNTGVQA